MKTKLLVTVDTEENWEGPGSNKKPNVSNVYKIIELQKDVFDKFNVRPVYLITYPVATDPNSVSILNEVNKSGKCEIGTHLHNWNSPPFTEKDVWEKSYHFKLPYSLEKQKISDLTKIIQDNLKTQPVTFRAGRWGADGETIKILIEIGYKIDTSVAPLVDYTKEGGMNFYEAPFEPYFPSFENIIIPTINKDLLEIPVTFGYSHINFERLRVLFKYCQGKRLKCLHIISICSLLNILRKIKFSPETASFGDMKRLTDLCLKRGYKILHLTFHSSMNSTGDSPYSKTEKERDKRIKDLQYILDYIVNSKKIKSFTAKDIYEEWNRE